MKPLALLFAPLLATTALATPPPAPTPPREATARKAARPDVPAWHDRYDMPWEVVPAKLSFADDKTHALLLRADAAARRIATPDWKQRAGEAYPYLSWNAGSSGYSRKYQAKWQSAGDAHHTIALSTEVYNTASNARGIEINASWTTWEIPNDWIASVRYMRWDEPAYQTLSLELFHPKLTPATVENPYPALSLAPGGPQFSTTRRDGDGGARFTVSSRAPTNGGSIYEPEMEDLARYWKSAESFRDAAIEELDRLEARCRKVIMSGEAAEVWRLADGGRVVMPLPPGEAISEEVRKSALDEALAEIAKRKKLVEDHHKEMYQAATSAFPPLVELLQGESTKR